MFSLVCRPCQAMRSRALRTDRHDDRKTFKHAAPSVFPVLAACVFSCLSSGSICSVCRRSQGHLSRDLAAWRSSAQAEIVSRQTSDAFKTNNWSSVTHTMCPSPSSCRSSIDGCTKEKRINCQPSKSTGLVKVKVDMVSQDMVRSAHGHFNQRKNKENNG